jgi:DNA-binding NarL/FixJ family response regulator/predicted DNA-binding transcriptional regulator AlpA
MDNIILNSWKEIAQYTGRSERTVQRWERRYGLPVRRPAGKQRSAVIALRLEIDAWIEQTPFACACHKIRPYPSEFTPSKSVDRQQDRSLATLLCIDDHREGLAVRKAFLEALGYYVLAASDGPTGLKLFRETAVDLVVLGYHPQCTDCEAIIKMLRQRWPEVPILVLSAAIHGVPEWVLQTVNGFIQKGQPSSVLLGTIERSLRKIGKPVASDSGGDLNHTRLPVATGRQPPATVRTATREFARVVRRA